jgi:hypothetical protein|tara:strand:- start:972 stop:1124 length:153 start_codon:yes stop_codon:yes gene_type:complete
MEEGLGWLKIYQSKCKENQELRQEIAVLQEILRSYLPVIDGKDNTNNKSR